jgi:hypothetical protein
MKAAIASGGLLAALLGAGAADAVPPPTPLTDVFIHFCGDTRGDADSALQLADAEEWSLAPKGMGAPSFGLGVVWIRRQARWTQAHGVRRVLLVGMQRDQEGEDTLTCTVSEMMPPGMKADVAGVQGALQKWVGTAPLRSSAVFGEFAYREAHGLRIAVPPSQDPLANDAPRAPPDVAEVAFNYVLGAMLTITYQRSHEGPVERPFGSGPSP